MLALRLVIDTSVLISAALKPEIRTGVDARAWIRLLGGGFVFGSAVAS
jgi:hypothetical protein